MAFTYGFYNSLNGDRRYSAEQVSEIFDGVLTDGIIPSQGQKFAVTTANNRMQINVGTGRAWFNHTWSKNDSIMILTVPPSDVSRPRYDAVVLEINTNDNVRANSIKIVQGEPLTNPVKPTLVNAGKIHQYPLAYIYVPAGSDTIKGENIENMVGRSPTVFATGVLQTTNLDTLWEQWRNEFNTWFAGIKAQLSGNIVTNLQYEIGLRVRYTDKATTAQAQQGTDNSHWMTPALTKTAAQAVVNTAVTSMPTIYNTTYVGNGDNTYTRTLTFPRKPLMVFIMQSNVFFAAINGIYNVVCTSSGEGGAACSCSWSGNSFTWTGSKVYNATYVCNSSNTTYYVVALLE